MALFLLLERSSERQHLRLDTFKLGQILVVQESADQVSSSIRDLLGWPRGVGSAPRLLLADRLRGRVTLAGQSEL